MEHRPTPQPYTVGQFREDQARFGAGPEDRDSGPRGTFAWRDVAPGCGTLEVGKGRLPGGLSLGLEVLHCRGRTLAMWRLDGAEVGFLLVRVGEA